MRVYSIAGGIYTYRGVFGMELVSPAQLEIRSTRAGGLEFSYATPPRRSSGALQCTATSLLQGRAGGGGSLRPRNTLHGSWTGGCRGVVKGWLGGGGWIVARKSCVHPAPRQHTGRRSLPEVRADTPKERGECNREVYKHNTHSHTRVDDQLDKKIKYKNNIISSSTNSIFPNL